jgi:VWFA-related protein
VFFAVLALIAATAAAQPHESITVQVIDVPVYVFRNGTSIRNLTKDDFELYVNGKRQTIDYFDPIEFTKVDAPPQAATAPTAPPADPRERRLFLLVFDLAYNRPAGLANARRAAAIMVDKALPEDFFAVATYGSRGANFVIPFTRDHEIIRRAVLKLSPSSAHDSLSISITDAERQSADAWNPSGGAGSGSGRAGAEDPMPEIMAGFATDERQRAKNASKSQLSELSKIAARLANLEGYKHMILFSEGFAADYFTGSTPNLGVLSYQGAMPPQVDNDMWQSLQTMVKSFHAAGVLLHTVDLRIYDSMSLDEKSVNIPGPMPVYSGGVPAKTQRFDTLANDTLYSFAEQTGGQFIHFTNDFSGALTNLSRTVSAGYRLGFKPINPRKGENSIDVKVKNVPSGTTISFRKGFGGAMGSPDTRDALLLADIIQNDIPQTGTPPLFAFNVRPFIDVVVPARQLAREHGAIKDASVLLYIFDDKGVAVLNLGKNISISPNTRSDAVVRQKLELPPGNYVAKALLRVDKSIGFAKVAFAIPDVK